MFALPHYYFKKVEAIADECIIKVALGKYHTLFLTHSGTVYACGLNSHNQCAMNTLQKERLLVPTLTYFSEKQVPVRDIAACSYGSAFLTVDGQLYLYGFTSSYYQVLVNKVGVPIQALHCLNDDFSALVSVNRRLYHVNRPKKKNDTVLVENVDIVQAFTFDDQQQIFLWLPNGLLVHPKRKAPLMKDVKCLCMNEHFAICTTK